MDVRVDNKENWMWKNWCLWTVVLEKALENPLDFEEIKPVNPKGKQYWIFIGGPDAETEAPILWPPDVTNQLLGKDTDAGEDRRQEEKGMTEDEMTGCITDSMDLSLSKVWELVMEPGVVQSMVLLRVGHNWVTELNWTGLYSPWNSPGQNTGVGSLSFLQGILPTQGLNWGLLHCRWILYQLSHKGSSNRQ